MYEATYQYGEYMLLGRTFRRTQPCGKFTADGGEMEGEMTSDDLPALPRLRGRRVGERGNSGEQVSGVRTEGSGGTPGVRGQGGDEERGF